MDNQWWITGLEGSNDNSELSEPTRLPKPSRPPNPENIGFENSEKKNQVMVGEDFFTIEEHFKRIRNIFLAPIIILGISAIIPPAALLMIPYPIYIFYSFLVSMDLRGRHLTLGFLIGILLTLPGIINIIRGENDYFFTLFIVPTSYVFYLLFALDSDSVGHKKTAIGMFYGILFGVFIYIPIFLAWIASGGWG